MDKGGNARSEEGKDDEGNEPFVLFPHVVPFAKVYEVRDRLSSKELQPINNVDLLRKKRQYVNGVVSRELIDSLDGSLVMTPGPS